MKTFLLFPNIQKLLVFEKQYNQFCFQQVDFDKREFWANNDWHDQKRRFLINSLAGSRARESANQ